MCTQISSKFELKLKKERPKIFITLMYRCLSAEATIVNLHLSVQSTIYMEPLPMVELNNTEAMLASAEEEEEMVILTALSRQA